VSGYSKRQKRMRVTHNAPVWLTWPGGVQAAEGTKKLSQDTAAALQSTGADSVLDSSRRNVVRCMGGRSHALRSPLVVYSGCTPDEPQREGHYECR
jgi:hypothetical protein